MKYNRCQEFKEKHRGTQFKYIIEGKDSLEQCMALIQANLALKREDHNTKSKHLVEAMRHFTETITLWIQIIIDRQKAKNQDQSTTSDSATESESDSETESESEDSPLVVCKPAFRRKWRGRRGAKHGDKKNSGNNKKSYQHRYRRRRRNSKPKNGGGDGNKGKQKSKNQREKFGNSKSGKSDQFRRRNGHGSQKSQKHNKGSDPSKPEQEKDEEKHDLVDFFSCKEGLWEAFDRFVKYYWSLSSQLTRDSIHDFWAALIPEKEDRSFQWRYFQCVGKVLVKFGQSFGLKTYEAACEAEEFEKLPNSVLVLDEFITCCSVKPDLFGSDLEALSLALKTAKFVVQGYEDYAEAVEIMSDGESESNSEAIAKLRSAKKMVGWRCPELTAWIVLQMAKYFLFVEDNATRAQISLDRVFHLTRTFSNSGSGTSIVLGRAKEFQAEVDSYQGDHFGSERDSHDWEEEMEDAEDDDREEKKKAIAKHYSEGFDSFLKFIFKHFPPIHMPKFCMPMLKYLPKKVLIKLVSWYHPDKIDRSKYGSSYQRDCEEIAKFLTKELTKKK